MTTQRAPLDYAGPGSDAGGRGYRVVAAALALAVGFLGANAFADAAGFPTPRDGNPDTYVMLRVLCGIVVFVVTFAVLAFLFREVRAVVHVLARTPHRPGLPIAMAALICGTTCVLAALALQLYWLRNPAITVGPGPQFSVQTPLMAHLLTIMAFLVGLGLIAIGIWSSMGRPALSSVPPPPPAA